MDLDQFLGADIMESLQTLKKQFTAVEFSKIDTDEFIILKENGFYLQSYKSGGLINQYRIFKKPYDDYVPIDNEAFLSFADINNPEEIFGSHIKEIPSINIPGHGPTPR